MNIKALIILITIISCTPVELTPTQSTLKENAITLRSLSKLNKKLYKAISPYDIIMLGEMHGTNEPAEFAYGLCQLISQHEDQVIMGMEIPPSQMDGFSDTMTVDQIKDLSFFTGENSSGMNGQAWLNLIAKSNENEKIIIKFFDYQRVAPRDSSMYNSIVDIRMAYPKTKIVTLSGNVHNRLEPYKDKLKLGAYVMNDTINFDENKIISVMHYFNQGTMLNNMGNGLELRIVEGKENIFNKTISADKFFCENIFENQTHFTHILYTEHVSHSDVIEINE